jgi:hypothetical protein
MAKHTFKGTDYSIYVIDKSDLEINPGIRIRFFDNALAEKLGIHCLDAIDLTVDEVVAAIISKYVNE